MRSGSRSLLVGSVAAMVLASGVTFLANERHIIIRACVDDRTGGVRILHGDDHCGKRETLLEWNVDGQQGPNGDGTRGSTGTTGTVGPAGPAGPQGPAGPAGPAGAKGATGATGPAGPAGPMGPTGPAGPAGPMGPAGPIGPIGPMGPIGQTGPAGPTGLTGPAGPIGQTGPAGAVGPAGPQGLIGLTGPAGPQGLIGPAGPQGDRGADGVAGAPGPQGPAGPAGGLKLVDANGVAIGYFQYPQLAAVQVGPDLVWIVMNMRNRNFDVGTPAQYYTSTDCTGQSYMYVDLFRLGTVVGTTLYYPAGEPAPMIYKSVKDENGCGQFTNEGNSEPDTFAPTAMTSLASFIAPFRISK